MFGSKNIGASAYAKVSLETGIEAATPHKLIVMLFDGALIAVTHARQHMQSHSIAEKGIAISKAIAIIENGLRASLNREAGGRIANNLDDLYKYMSSRLLEANLKNDGALLEEVHQLLADLKGAWEAIAPAASSTQGAAGEMPMRAKSDAYTPTTLSLAKA